MKVIDNDKFYKSFYNIKFDSNQNAHIDIERIKEKLEEKKGKLHYHVIIFEMNEYTKFCHVFVS